MTSLPFPAVHPVLAAVGRDRVPALAAIPLVALLLAALARHLAAGGAVVPAGTDPWLIVHLTTVIPALPLGAYVLVRRKGDRVHRLLGRVWVALMMGAALSSFGLHYLTGGFSWIHLLSILTLVSLPRSILMAARGNIRAHMRGMRIVYAALVIAGGFAFLPGRLFGEWLFG